MASVTRWVGIAVALPALWPQPATARLATLWDVPIAEASARFGLPEPWIRRVIHAESAGRTMHRGRPIRSHAGAMGLMQLMPGTWLAMRRTHGLGDDPDDPRDNILAGAAYLRAMYDRFGYPGLFAAYNAGPARYAEHLGRGRRLPAETLAYVAKVTGVRAQGASRPARAGLAQTGASPRVSPSPFWVTGPVGRAAADRNRRGLFFELAGSRGSR